MPVSLLLIEGRSDHAQTVVNALVDQWLGWHVEVVPTLGQVSDALAKRHFDAVLTAQRLADGSAFDVLSAVPDLPAIILIPEGAETYAAQAMRYGFSDFVLQDEAGSYLLTLPAQIEAVLERSTAVRTRHSAELLLARQHQLLQAISQAQAAFITDQSSEAAFRILLQEMVALTQSGFGLIAQIPVAAAPHGTLHVHRLIAGDAAEPSWPALPATPHDIVLPASSCLLHAVFDSGTPLIRNNLTQEPPRCSLPAHYPPATTLLGLPIHGGGAALGVVLLANRRAGYSSADVHFLQPLLGTISQLEMARRAALVRCGVEERLAHTSALLAEKTQALELTLDSVSQGIAYLDDHQQLQVYNQRCLELLDLPATWQPHTPQTDALLGQTIQRCELGGLVPEDAPADFPEICLRTTATGRYLEVRTRTVPNGGSVHTFTDVSDYLGAQEALRTSEERWRSLTELSSDWYWEQDAEFRFLPVQGAKTHPLDFPEQGYYGLTRWELPHAGVTEAQWQQHRTQLQARERFHDFEMQRMTADGTTIWVSSSGEPMFDRQGNFVGYRGVARNITARKQAEAEIQRLAFYDDLTNLPNRRLLLERLNQAIGSCEDGHSYGALIFLDLDNFKDINDTLGHEWGDLLLVQVGQRMLGCVHRSDTVARLGGDEFVVILEGLHAVEAEATAQAEAVAQSILSALNQPYNLQGCEIHSTPSIGVALFSGPGYSAQDLLKRTDLAMYHAKHQGRNTVCFFDLSMQVSASARSLLEADMRQGLQREEFFLHYQPVVDADGLMLGAEALVRWQHPQRGLVPPGQFIGVAETTGMILTLGRQVLRAACQQLARWSQQNDCAHWFVAVNVSAQEFRHPDFVQQVISIFEETGADPHQLKLELTESLLLHDVEDSIAKMQALRTLGIGFSLDDFGTGYSSLSYLKRLPLDQLKIDQSFVRDVLTDPNDAAIACTVVALAHSLGLDVVAEGVESEGQHAFLLRNGCRRFQGYLFGRPGPEANLPR